MQRMGTRKFSGNGVSVFRRESARPSTSDLFAESPYLIITARAGLPAKVLLGKWALLPVRCSYHHARVLRQVPLDTSLWLPAESFSSGMCRLCRCSLGAALFWSVCACGFVVLLLS